jgi:hypothetical protein
MQYLPAELALANLKGEIDSESRGHMTKAAALTWLRELTGQDDGPTSPLGRLAYGSCTNTYPAVSQSPTETMNGLTSL